MKTFCLSCLHLTQAQVAVRQGNTEILGFFRLHTQGKTIAADDRCWPEMLRVHYRDGGGWLGILPFKYLLRKMISPLWRRRLLWKMRPG